MTNFSSPQTSQLSALIDFRKSITYLNVPRGEGEKFFTAPRYLYERHVEVGHFDRNAQDARNYVYLEPEALAALDNKDILRLRETRGVVPFKLFKLRDLGTRTRMSVEEASAEGAAFVVSVRRNGLVFDMGSSAQVDTGKKRRIAEKAQKIGERMFMAALAGVALSVVSALVVVPLLFMGTLPLAAAVYAVAPLVLGTAASVFALPMESIARNYLAGQIKRANLKEGICPVDKFARALDAEMSPGIDAPSSPLAKMELASAANAVLAKPKAGAEINLDLTRQHKLGS